MAPVRGPFDVVGGLVVNVTRRHDRVARASGGRRRRLPTGISRFRRPLPGRAWASQVAHRLPGVPEALVKAMDEIGFEASVMEPEGTASDGVP